MNLLFDTNIVLDVLLDRIPFSEAAAILFSRVEQAKFNGFLCATTLTTVHYLTAKSEGKNKADAYLQELLAIFDVAVVNRSILEAASQSGFADFEDAVIYQSAITAGADCIITRDQNGFKQSRLPTYTAGDFLNLQAIIR